MVPLCSYAREERLQGVALTSNLPSTTWTTCPDGPSSAKWLCRPAVLLSCLALAAKPEDLLMAFQPDFVGKVPVNCIATVVPLCQQDRVLCNSWVLDLLVGLCILGALWAARFLFAASGINCGTPSIATGITVPPCRLIALCHHTVKSAIICLAFPLSCH